MSKTTTFLATMTNGEIAKRTSQNRTYTHCVQLTDIAIWSAIDGAKAGIERLEETLVRYEAITTDEQAFNESPVWMQTRGKAFTAADYAGWATSTRSSLALLTENLAFYEARAAAGERFASDHIHVETWCGRYDLAIKQYNSLNGSRGRVATILDVVVK